MSQTTSEATMQTIADELRRPLETFVGEPFTDTNEEILKKNVTYILAKFIPRVTDLIDVLCEPSFEDKSIYIIKLIDKSTGENLTVEEVKERYAPSKSNLIFQVKVR